MPGAKLAKYVRQAERYGCEGVFEAATADLGAQDLGRLSLRLQNIDPKWKMPRADRHRLALGLIAAGGPDDRTCRMAQTSRTTLWRHRDAQDTPQSPPEPAFQSGGSVSERCPAVNGSRTAVAVAESPQRGES